MKRSIVFWLLPLFTLACADKSDTQDTGISQDTADTNTTVPPIDADSDGFYEHEDCDDNNADIHPDATEVCNEVDDNCNGLVDDDDPNLVLSTQSDWFRDADNDGFGNESDSQRACSAPAWHVEESAAGFDCDDTDPAFYPGADESDCSDPNDYNCDGSVAYADADADGWAACMECDDSDPAINPDAVEICDEVDNDCDSATDDADDSLDSETATPWYADTDNDGFGDLANSVLLCERPTGYVADNTDCDDGDNNAYPGATEYCDGHDDNCDGTIDEDSAVDAKTWYQDSDGDTYGDSAVTDIECYQPTGYVDDNTDCDDGDNNAYPGATEYCDGHDDNCDGTIDEDSAVDAKTWYEDSDGDTYGLASSTTQACNQPSGYAANNTDCDDTNVSLYPGAVANIVTVKACIDGSDWLYVKGTSLWWVHRNHAKVGQHSNCGSFTYTVVDGTNWSHSWSGNTTNTYSGMATRLPATATLSVSVSNAQGRGSISVAQQPSASNGYTAAVLFNDDGPGGAASYQMTLSATCQ